MESGPARIPAVSRTSRATVSIHVRPSGLLKCTYRQQTSLPRRAVLRPDEVTAVLTHVTSDMQLSHVLTAILGGSPPSKCKVNRRAGEAALAVTTRHQHKPRAPQLSPIPPLKPRALADCPFHGARWTRLPRTRPCPHSGVSRSPSSARTRFPGSPPSPRRPVCSSCTMSPP